ncbi:hypothetical protein JCM11641_008112 [Rhodosporidiobolus odoratus]
MAAPVSRMYLAWLAVCWAFSVVSLGLSARIISHGTIFPSSEFHGVLIQNVFAQSWNTLFTTLFLIGSAVAARSIFFGAAANFVFIFLGFLQTIVGLGSFSAVVKQYGIPEMNSIYKAYWGIGWVTTFFIMFAALYAGKEYLTGQATPVKQHKEEHF